MLLEKWIDDDLLSCAMSSDFPDELTSPACLSVGIAFCILVVVVIAIDLERSVRD
jgi:hypothetical protein